MTKRKKRRVNRSKSATREPWPNQINFPPELPISDKVDAIQEALKDHQVVIVAGETGSGKTTQLPKICLDLGYGERGQIAHTQPRRIAARTVADRVARELNTTLGDGVGYQIRFTDKSNKNTRIKLMTDGVLLSEFQSDRQLRKYDVIILDEAHERSLNIDFLLGLLKTLCRQRPNLKLIITSATIDVEKFAQHFSHDDTPAPIIEVSGRLYPVDTLYHPSDDNNRSLPDQITQTCKDIIRGEAKGEFNTSGDILVFCAGEREIRESALALRRAQLPIEVLPLYSRLSVAEQNKVFQPAHRRKVVLATNVAETSLTVPGIAYVIDPGLARISRYSFRSKVQRLPIERISQASADQRKGRSGRVANGVCVRLYSEEDFEQRAEFTPPEILRSNLASVVLKMLRLGIKEISNFEFIDKPDQRLLNDAYKLLIELGAIDTNRRLTALGRRMSDLPIDPKYARILLAAEEQGCLRDALVVVSALSIQDPRERPADKQQAADQRHARLHHPRSDFVGYLFLWQAVLDARDQLSNTKFKQYCLDNYWSISRVFEWRELCRQLLLQCKQLGLKVEDWQEIPLPENESKKSKNALTARHEKLHRALIPGLVGNLATKDQADNYTATRSRQIHLFPGSATAKQQPKWVIAAELLETSRLYAHTVGEIQPAWVVPVAQHLCKYTYNSPHYHVRSGTVKANRTTLLYGLVLKQRERVNYAPINANETREIFIQQALVEGRYQPKSNTAQFVAHNQALIAEIEKLETKTRRRNLLVNDHAVYSFYAAGLPESVNSRQSLEHWLQQGNQDVLKLDRETLLQSQVDESHGEGFPDRLTVLGKEVSLDYKFNPGRRSDGVTMTIPISVLAPFPEHIGDWLVPGLLLEKCTALIKTLPKPIRRNFAPAADAINRIADRLEPADTPLIEVLADLLYRTRGVKVSAEDFAPDKLDQFYLMNYRVIDIDGSLVEEGRDLISLKQRYAHAVKESVHAKNSPERNKLERHGIESWDFGELRNSAEYQHQGMTVRAYPMLQASEGGISLLVHDEYEVAQYHSHLGVIALAKKVLSNTTQKQTLKYLRKELMVVTNKQKSKQSGLSNLAQQLKAAKPTQANRSQWIEPIIDASLNHCCFNGQSGSIRTEAEFTNALTTGAKHWVKAAVEMDTLLSRALDLRDELLARLNQIQANVVRTDLVLEDVKAQIYRLFEPSMLSYTSIETLRQLPRYLSGIDARLEKLPFKSKHAQEELALDELQKSYDARVQELTKADLELDFAFLTNPALAEYRIMLEEWRVSIFAQHLRTNMKVSEKRLRTAWNDITS